MAAIVRIREYGRAEEMKRCRSAFYRAQFSGEREEIKQPQRERVMEFILRHHPAGYMRFLGMPGASWTFEHQLEHNWNWPVRFVGIEWNYSVIERGKIYMPGRCLQYGMHQYRIGDLHFVKTSQAVWLYGHASNILRTVCRKDKGSKKLRRQFARRFKNRTAIWLDVNPNMSPELLLSFNGIGGWCDYNHSVVPFALTFIIGQEHKRHRFGWNEAALTPIEKRLPAIEASINGHGYRVLKVMDAWQYESGYGCHMGTVCGLLIYFKKKRSLV